MKTTATKTISKPGKGATATHRGAREHDVVQQMIAARKAQGLTQAELAARIGMQQSGIARFESGAYNPTLGFLERLAEGLRKKLVVTLK